MIFHQLISTKFVTKSHEVFYLKFHIRKIYISIFPSQYVVVDLIQTSPSCITSSECESNNKSTDGAETFQKLDLYWHSFCWSVWGSHLNTFCERHS